MQALRVSYCRYVGIMRKRTRVDVGLGLWQLDVDMQRRGVGDAAQRTGNMKVRHSSMG
jgi:hypothetical protein